MAELVLLIVLAVFFALNMGGTNFGASFGPAYGCGVVSKKKALVLFSVFVILGALTLGRYVSRTLGSGISIAELEPRSCLVIFVAAGLSLFVCNLLRVPQSTSFITVGAIAGVAMRGLGLQFSTLCWLLALWLILPALAYLITFLLGRALYPPRPGNFRYYEKWFKHEQGLKKLVLASSCYNAFAVGSNNVANVVGPLSGAGLLSSSWGLLLLAPIFGLGGLIFRGGVNTTGKEIVPLGSFTAVVSCLVVSTLMIVASALGLPQSAVLLQIAAIFGISSLKDGPRLAASQPIARRIVASWVISPLVALLIAWLLAGVVK